MRRCEGGNVSSYRPPNVAELSPRECAEAQAMLRSAEARLREVWRWYLGQGAELAEWRVGAADEVEGAQAWQCGTWKGRVRCGAELQRGIVAAATGFDEVVSERDRPLGAAETAVLRTLLAAALRSLLEAFGLQAREAVRWRDEADGEAEAGMIVRAAGSAAGMAGEIALHLPLAVVRRPQTALTEEERAGLRDAVRGVAVTVQATVAGPRLTTEEIANLALGDIVLLGGPSMEQVSVIVSGRPVAHGQAGFRSEKLAIRITEMPLTNEVHNGDGHR